jgi:aryl-alcohol dehydrogenase-like predicted oxidoreductase
MQPMMRYRLLGASGLRVSEICLGTMTFGEDWGWGADREESRRIFDTFAASGGNFIDTANSYTGGTSERFLGEFIAGDRDRFVIASKYTHAERFGDPNSGGNHRKSLRQAVQASLRRLNTDYIDLLWMHAWDAITPIDEVVRALDDLVQTGDVLYTGISDSPAWVAAHANAYAELRGWTRFIGIQAPYSLIERSIERDVLPMSQALDMAVVAWAPLGAGLLTGKYLDNDADRSGRLATSDLYRGMLDKRNVRIAASVQAVAGRIGRTATHVALAWVRSRGANIIPIVGARTADQLSESLGALDLTLDEESVSALDAASAIPLGFPSDFLAWGPVRHMVYGGTYDSIATR